MMMTTRTGTGTPTIVDSIHGRYVHNRRVSVLRSLIAPLLFDKAKVLDVGCGDGLLARTIMDVRPDVAIEGIDVLVRSDAKIPVAGFDGKTIPHDDGSFDVALFVDVLHHADDGSALLKEARRVARRAIVIKDHLNDRFLANPTLAFMDRVGNARHGVALPYRYWGRSRWLAEFDAIGMTRDSWNTDLRLYPFWADWLFGGSLHFVARLAPSDS